MTDMNRRLTEMMGKCWHELPLEAPYHECIKCGARMPWWNPDYSKGADKAALMDFCVEQEWWGDFCGFVGHKLSEQQPIWHSWHFTLYLWCNLPELVAEYKGWRER